MSFSVSDTVGPYRILEELGRGGMGRVFKVEHNVTERLEAIKLLERGRAGELEQADRSLREIRLQARLDHPNIAAIHNAFWAGGDLVLVMELIDGCSLRRLMEAGPLPLETAIDYACQALSALTYAHARGVIHRDVSPSNMIVSPGGVLKLTDFGLAKGAADRQVSQSGAPLGSLYYMSPEQVRGTAPPDVRSDIYSLGAVLYELVTGRKPFDGDSAFSIMVDQVENPPAPPVELAPSLPRELNCAILKALEKDPSRRFSSAEEFRQALRQPAMIRPAQLAARPGSWPVRVAAAVGIVALAAAALLFVERPVAPVEKPAVVVTDPSTPNRAVTPAEPVRPTPAEAASPRKPNPIRRALGKLWRLPRRKATSPAK